MQTWFVQLQMQELVTGSRDRIHLAFVPVRCVNTVFVRHAGSLGTRGVQMLLTSPAQHTLQAL